MLDIPNEDTGPHCGAVYCVIPNQHGCVCDRPLGLTGSHRELNECTDEEAEAALVAAQVPEVSPKLRPVVEWPDR
jgi:hypothetical protein